MKILYEKNGWCIGRNQDSEWQKVFAVDCYGIYKAKKEMIVLGYSGWIPFAQEQTLGECMKVLVKNKVLTEYEAKAVLKNLEQHINLEKTNVDTIIELDITEDEFVSETDDKEPTLEDMKTEEVVSTADWNIVECRHCHHKNDILLCKFRGGNLVCLKCGGSN